MFFLPPRFSPRVLVAAFLLLGVLVGTDAASADKTRYTRLSRRTPANLQAVEQTQRQQRQQRRRSSKSGPSYRIAGQQVRIGPPPVGGYVRLPRPIDNRLRRESDLAALDRLTDNVWRNFESAEHQRGDVVRIWAEGSSRSLVTRAIARARAALERTDSEGVRSNVNEGKTTLNIAMGEPTGTIYRYSAREDDAESADRNSHGRARQEQRQADRSDRRGGRKADRRGHQRGQGPIQDRGRRSRSGPQAREVSRDEQNVETEEVQNIEVVIENGALVAIRPASGQSTPSTASGELMETDRIPAMARNATNIYTQPDPHPYRRGADGVSLHRMEPRRHTVFEGSEADGEPSSPEEARMSREEIAARHLTLEAFDRGRQLWRQRNRPGSRLLRTRNGWEIERDGVLVSQDDSGAMFMTVNMGRRVGYADGPMGEALGRPGLDHIQIAIVDGVIVNSAPMSMGVPPPRYQGGELIGPASRQHRLPRAAASLPEVSYPDHALSMAEMGEELARRLTGPQHSPAQRDAIRRIATRNTRGLTSLGSLSEAARLRTPARHVALGLATDAQRGTDLEIVGGNGFVSTVKRGIGTVSVQFHLGPENFAQNPVPRQDDFRIDLRLPPAFRVMDEDIGARSTFNNHVGHLYSSGVANGHEMQNSDTFLYSNLILQSANNNTGAWNGLEQYTRLLIRQGHRMTVYLGGLLLGDTPQVSPRLRKTSHTYAVIVLHDREGRVTANSRVISMLLPDNNFEVTRTDRWTDYLTTPEHIMRLAALDQRNGDAVTNHGGPVHFFRALPPDVARSLMTRRDNAVVSDEITAMRSYLPNAVEETWAAGAFPEQPYLHQD